MGIYILINPLQLHIQLFHSLYYYSPYYTGGLLPI